MKSAAQNLRGLHYGGDGTLKSSTTTKSAPKKKAAAPNKVSAPKNKKTTTWDPSLKE